MGPKGALPVHRAPWPCLREGPSNWGPRGLNHLGAQDPEAFAPSQDPPMGTAACRLCSSPRASVKLRDPISLPTP